MVTFTQNSQKHLISSIQLSVRLNKNIGRVAYSNFNLIVLSFLCNRGFIDNFQFFKKGSNVYIEYSLRRMNGSLVVNSIRAPFKKDSNSLSYFSKYKTYKSLARFFNSEFVVISTNQGLMTANEAISLCQGGVVVCIIT